MQISHRHRFIFIHIFKTGGTSVRAALNRFTDRPELLLWNRVRGRLGFPPPSLYPGLSTHARAIEIQSALPAEVFGSCFKFAFVRNPWDWHVSFFHYIRQTRAHHEHAPVSRLDFEDYLRYRMDHPVWQQKAFVTDACGAPLVDFVGRYERLDADFSRACAAIGVRTRLRRVNRSRHRDYRTYHTDRTRALVEQCSREDIEYFGYRFDPPTVASQTGTLEFRHRSLALDSH